MVYLLDTKSSTLDEKHNPCITNSSSKSYVFDASTYDAYEFSGGLLHLSSL